MNRLILAAVIFALSLPAASLTSVCTGSPAVCGASVVESAVGNLARLDLYTDLSGTSPATGAFTLSQAFLTGGPVRPGFVVFDLGLDGDYGAGAFSSGSATFDSFSCASSAQVGQICYFQSQQPILLGMALPVTMSASLSRGTFQQGILESAYRDIILRAAFYEDGGGGALGAPVPVSLAPEPASMAMMGAAMLALVGAIRRRSK